MLERQFTAPWLGRYAWLCAAATLGLIAMGGLVTSRGAGLAVPDWPTSYGYNMFALPLRFWQGGIFYEHTHRLWATVVGTLVVFLTRWLGGHRSRRALAGIGLAEVLAGMALVWLRPELKGAGHFLAGIGGVVLAAAAVWARNPPAPGRLPVLGWAAFWLVQIQGLLGGLRVVWLADELGVVHGVLAQGFLLVLVVIAVKCSGWWWRGPRLSVPRTVRGLTGLATGLVAVQLILGAAMRHRHAGLAVPDFPLAYGRVWPRLDAEAIAGYNRQRLEVHAARPIAATDVVLHMSHRAGAVATLLVVGAAWWAARRRLPKGDPLRRGAGAWLALIGAQFALGALTVWTNKAADIATAHVVTGSLSLVTGGVLCLLTARRRAQAPAQSVPTSSSGRPGSPAWSVAT